MKKTTTGSSVSYETKAPSAGVWPAEFTHTTNSADINMLEEYFAVSNVFSTDPAVNYHHQIDSENNVVMPTTEMQSSLSNDIRSYGPYSIQVDKAQSAISVDEINGSLAYTVSVIGA